MQSRFGRRRGRAMLVGAVALTVFPAACARDAAAPIAAPAAISASEASQVEASGAIPCAASRACGGFYAQINGYYANIAGHTFGPSRIGAYAKTWTPNQVAMPVSIAGGGSIHRGSSINAFTLYCNLFATYCAAAYALPNTCAFEHNDVGGTTFHYAGIINTLNQYRGTFSGYVACDPPPPSNTGGGCGEEDTSIYTDLEDPGYDPYNDDSGSCGSGASGDPPTPGSGIQYNPGQNTGGETVDFGTGRGNGGTSVCGETAIVDFVCFDEYNEDTGEWEEWGCGYVTTC
jgi:hypothetical protein